MNDLKSFCVLQARIYEFLIRQDESNWQAIIDGTAEFAIVLAGEAAPAELMSGENTATTAQPHGPAADPPHDPVQAVVEDLLRRPREQRVGYLWETKLIVDDLNKVAKRLGLRNYGKLRKADLINELASYGSHTSGVPEDGSHLPIPASPGQPNEPMTPNPDAVRIAARLREIETEREGAAYLSELRLDKTRMLAVAAELHLTRVNRLSLAELERRMLKQAIGARRKFAGLRKW